MIKRSLAPLVVAAALAASSAVSAQTSAPVQPSFYIGGDIGQAEVGSTEDTAFKLFGGYQFNRNLAAEVGYGMLIDQDNVEVTSLEAVGVGLLPLGDRFSLLGKIGVANVDVETPGGSDDKTELTYGFGVQFDMSRNLGLRAQWQRYDTDDEIDLFTVGAVWRF